MISINTKRLIHVNLSHLIMYDTLTQLKQQGSKHYILTHRTIASTRELLVKEGMLEFLRKRKAPGTHLPPPYSPQLNLMEGVWKWLKESVILTTSRKSNSRSAVS